MVTGSLFREWRFPDSLTLVLSVTVCLFILTTPAVYAQSDRAKTEKELALLRDEIASQEESLAVTEKTERASLKKLGSIDRQIGKREKLVTTFQTRLSALTQERDSLRSSIENLRNDLSDLKNEYRARATHAYRYGRMHDIALILSARSINEMLVRIRYLHRFSSKRQTQLQQINETTDLLKRRRTDLQRSLTRNEVLLNSVRKEQDKLGKLRNDRKKQISALRRQKSTLKKSIDENLGSASRLEQQIQTLIAAEIARNRNGAAGLSSSALSTAFRSQKGMLTWPSAGSVSEPFGETINPQYGTRTPNPGIVIETNASAEVRSVFGGRITTIDVMPDLGRYMIIEHGEYHSVYGNLSLFYVSQGENIEAGQLIGRAGTDAEPKGTAVFFGIFENGQAIDPAPWLSGN
jgi:murein hydrolase activator